MFNSRKVVSQKVEAGNSPIKADAMEERDAAKSGEQLALATMAIDLADPKSRAMVRKTVEQFGPNGTTALKSKMLGKRFRQLAQADAGSAAAAEDMRRLMEVMRRLDPSYGKRGRPGLLRKLLNPTAKKLEQLSASREEIELILASLIGSAEVLRQNEVALDGFEADIRSEAMQIAEDVELADDYESALVSAIAKAKAEQDKPDVVRYVETEALYPLEQHRQYLQSLRAVNQQAAFSLSILRETNEALMHNIRLVTAAARHSLDVAAMLRRPQGARESAGGASAAEVPYGLETFQESLDDLSRALEAHEAWRVKALPSKDEALLKLRDLSADTPREPDYA